MSIRIVTKGDRSNRNEGIRRKVFHHGTEHKPFHNVSKPSPTLSDKSEFPSLNEVSGKVSNNSHSGGGILKYSDKLKSYSTIKNQTTVPNFFHYKNDPVVKDTYKELDHSTPSNQFVNKWFHDENKINFKGKGTFQNEPDKRDFDAPKNVGIDSSQNISELRSTESHSSKFIDQKTQLPKQKKPVNTTNSKLHASHKASVLNSNSPSSSSKSNKQSQLNKEAKSVLENRPVKEGKDSLGTATTKKKRKSKIKRQVALQTGKIMVLTPEVHSKILNQTSALISQNFRDVLTDINNEEEYPELGKSFVSNSQKENCPKKESNSTQSTLKAVNKNIHMPAEKQLVSKDAIKNDKSLIEKKGKNDNKTVRQNDPITVSFYDILLNKTSKSKVKDFKVEVNDQPSVGLVKVKSKKIMCNPHNWLDSSSPAIKRGKEREKPKPKKTSQLKKIILLDRKVRREQFLQSKRNNLGEENAIFGNESGQEVFVCKNSEMETKNLSENFCENSPSNMFTVQLEVSDQSTLLSLDENLNDQVDLVSEMELMSISGINETLDFKETSDSFTTSTEDLEEKHLTEESVINSSLNKVSINENSEHVESEVTTGSTLIRKSNSDVSETSDLLLNSLMNNIKTLDISEKEKAVKLVLHTRNFREYCNHLISKDIDDVVFSLLDDLARFQDRLHQKDPIKARMKRRMIYGVKEVKKNIKLKKLKCIIVAADIENIQAHGGLNDLLNDIKSSAADHHIPCVFALGRKLLGKVCRKPVPVSCVGVFNFEGSESNFKKMVELKTQSKIDYAEIFNKLSLRLTEEQVATLIKAKKEEPETLHAIRTKILSDFLLEPNSEGNEHDKVDIKPEKLSDLSDTEE